MTYQVRILSRDFHQLLPFGGELKAETLSWSTLGGPEEALQTANSPLYRFEDWKQLLCFPIEIYSESGLPIWWGYLHSISQPFGSFTLSVSMDDLANRVAVRYVDLLGEQILTPWAENVLSQSLFGVQEKIIDLGPSTQNHALQTRDLTLQSNAFPTENSLPRTASRIQRICPSTSLAGAGSIPSLAVTTRAPPALLAPLPP